MNSDKSIVYQKAFDFSVRVINMYKYLCSQKREYTLAKQLLRSGTGIGANIREGLEGQSRKDFVAKFSIALKEAAETEYWIELLVASDIMGSREVASILKDVKELNRLLTSILKTSRESL